VGSLLFAVSPADPTVYLITALATILLALAAAAVPAIRAMRVDPTVALRHE